MSKIHVVDCMHDMLLAAFVQVLVEDSSCTLLTYSYFYASSFTPTFACSVCSLTSLIIKHSNSWLCNKITFESIE